MSPELESKLCEKYPKIFANTDKDMMESCMYWGLEIGDGWYDLIDTLCGTIQNWIDYNPGRNIPQVVAAQVKEKFGTLRFYVDGGDDYTTGMIMLAENMSSRICETCGKSGNVMGGGWLTTLCKEHAEARDIYEDDEEDETC